MQLLSQGLVVPVIRSVDGMNFTDIEKAINLLGEKVIIFSECDDRFRVVCSYFFFLILTFPHYVFVGP